MSTSTITRTTSISELDLERMIDRLRDVNLDADADVNPDPSDAINDTLQTLAALLDNIRHEARLDEPAVRVAIILEQEQPEGCTCECDHGVAINAVFSSRDDTVFVVVPTGDIAPEVAFGLDQTGFCDNNQSERAVKSGIDGQDLVYDISQERLPYEAKNALFDSDTFHRMNHYLGDR
jgi:hypothetical protein